MPTAKTMSIFKVLADEHRCKMVMLLGKKEQTVGALEKSLGLSQSSTSQHLKLLFDARLISYRKYGNFRFYSLKTRELQKAMHSFDRLWDEGLDRMKKNLEHHG